VTRARSPIVLPAVEPNVSVVVESYTHGEGSSLARVTVALEAATSMGSDVEVLVADSSGDPALVQLLENRFPAVRRCDATGLGYDEAKMKAAAAARGEYVLYLDGDCIPAPGWLEHHLRALRGGADATGGFTRYDGDFVGAVESVLDFGFMLPAKRRVLDCYAFNNSGFRRDVLLAKPVPPGPLRCRCYPHAQLLRRSGSPVRMVPEARVRHERQPFFRERFRQGYDMVAAGWADPALREGRLARLRLAGAPLFYGRAVVNDWRRLAAGRRDLGLRAWEVPAAAALLPVLRLVDLAGIVRALAPGGRESGVGLEATRPAEAS
jgi:glycosyltransferase involved in cell wall biosynthesis